MKFRNVLYKEKRMTELEEKAHDQLVTAIWGGFQDEGLTLADLIAKHSSPA